MKVMRENYANFNGRARRKEYWMFSLFFLLFAIAATIVIRLSSEVGETALKIAVIFVVVWYLAHIVPSLAVTVRRLHDTGKSGWLYLLVLIPYIGGLIIFIFTVVDGDKGDNAYGPDPKSSKISTTQKVTLSEEVLVNETSSNEEIDASKNKKRSGSTGWIIFGYIFALLGGPLGIAMGAHYAFWGKNYDANTRKNGIIILVIGCISFMIWRVISEAL